MGQIPGSIRGKYKNDQTQAERINTNVWGKSLNSRWVAELHAVFEEAELNNTWTGIIEQAAWAISGKLFVGFGAKWLKVIASKPKLQSSVQIKHSYSSEARVGAELGRSRRSLVVNLRTRWHMVSSLSELKINNWWATLFFLVHQSFSNRSDSNRWDHQTSHLQRSVTRCHHISKRQINNQNQSFMFLRLL